MATLLFCTEKYIRFNNHLFIIFTSVKRTENGTYSYNFTSKSVILLLFPGFLAFYTKNIQIFQKIQHGPHGCLLPHFIQLLKLFLSTKRLLQLDKLYYLYG